MISKQIGSWICAFLLFVLSYACRSLSTSRSLFHGINKQESANTETGKLWVVLACSCKQYNYSANIPNLWYHDPAFNTDNINRQNHSATFGVRVHKERRKSRETTVIAIGIIITLRFLLGSLYRRYVSMTVGP